MSNILQGKVKIQGTRPILWHAFTPDAIPLTPQERTGVAGNDPEEWKRTVLKTKEGQLYLLPTAVFSCLREAARHTKKGRGSIQSDVSATLQVVDDVILTNRYLPEIPNDLPQNELTAPVYLHIASVRNPSTKGRNVRYRVAASAGWELGFTFLWDKTVVNRNQIESVLNDAGRLVGLGDGRGIGFGRFTITEFQVTDLE